MGDTEGGGSIHRRAFLQGLGAAGVGVSCARYAKGADLQDAFADASAVLVDLPKCIGCRMCEYACMKEAGFDTPAMATFNDQSVLLSFRRLHRRSYTIINEFNDAERGRPIYTKSNCLHCNHPACVSACPVGALTKAPFGAVVYHEELCMGCRYCMIACPFQVPAYDYDNPTTPEVRKCNFCAQRIKDPGKRPACVDICPTECMTYGRRGELLELAREKITRQPDLYVDCVYGASEAGGTSWLYLSSVPFEDLRFITLGSSPPSHLTERIQHRLLSHFQAPIALFALLSAVMWQTRRRPKDDHGNTPGDGQEAAS